MIRKEFFKTREDGISLYRAYSDTGHMIRKSGTDEVYTEAVDVSGEIEYVEETEYVALEGPDTYEEVVDIANSYAKEKESVSKKINRLGLTDNEALTVKEYYPDWSDYVGVTIEDGFITQHNGNLWRARQTHTALEVYPPSINTAALYEVIVESHTGEKDDPIPYTPPMEIFKDKYYTQNGVVYLCTRDSGVALSHDLASLVGIYVELID